MENIPKKIYLQIGEDCPHDVDFNELVGVSWCADKINENDIEFVLVREDENPFDMSNPIYEAGYNQGHFDAKYSEEIAREMDEQKEV